MAATKKSMAIKQEKIALASEIDRLQDSIKDAACKVPDSVMRGSHQSAVDWKNAIESALTNRMCITRANLKRTKSSLVSKHDLLALILGKLI